MSIVLKPEDKIEVIIPGYAVHPQLLRKALDRLKKLKYQVHLPRHANKGFSFHSQTDEVRFQLLKKALQSKTHLIWSLRGGYGSNRLLPFLVGLKKPKQKKLLIGISDVASLHVFFNQVWAWPSLHASLLDRMGQKSLPAKVEKELWDILHGKIKSVEFRNLKPLNLAARKKKILRGKVVGGNLTVLQSLLGTPWQLNAKNKFLFIEDVGERGYRVDRILEHMKQAGQFRGCRGILVGQFVGGEEPHGKRARINEALVRFAESTSIPVVAGIESGHDVQLRSLPFLTPAVLNLQKKTLEVSCRF